MSNLQDCLCNCQTGKQLSTKEMAKLSKISNSEICSTLSKYIKIIKIILLSCSGQLKRFKSVVCCGLWGPRELMPDGSVSCSSVLKAISSYCSCVSPSTQCGNAFALKDNLRKHDQKENWSVLEAIRFVWSLCMQMWKYCLLTTFIILLAHCFAFQM